MFQFSQSAHGRAASGRGRRRTVPNGTIRQVINTTGAAVAPRAGPRGGQTTGARRPEVTVAPTGARRTSADHPQLPITIDEIAVCARLCQAAGAQRIHLHVRDDTGAHSLDCGRYREATAAVRAAAPGMAIQLTTEAAGRFGVAAQLAVIEGLRPGEASVSIRETMRDRALAARLYAAAAEAGTNVQHILYDLQDIALLRRAQAAGIVPDTSGGFLLVLGRYQPPRDAQAGDLAPLLAALQPGAAGWSACAFGRSEHACLIRAAAMGGHLRVGFENNVCRPDGTLARDNAENVARIVNMVRGSARALPAKVSA